MKLLYVSSYHPTLEYDDLKLFEELGFKWFSTGIYSGINRTDDDWRKNLVSNVEQDTKDLFFNLNPTHSINRPFTVTKEFINKFDVVVCNYSHLCRDLIDSIWPYCDNVPVIFRTYGQQFSDFEVKLYKYFNAGMYLVRASSSESKLNSYAGHTKIIRCYVDESIYTGWTGGQDKVLSFSNDFSARFSHPNFNCYRAYYSHIMPKLPCELYGVGSEAAGGGGFISWENQIEKYKKCNVYFALGSPPAFLTFNLVEAWMTGTPLVTFGNFYGNAVNMSTYEATDLIENGVNGFYSDNLDQLVQICNNLREDEDLRKAISTNGSAKAKEVFSKTKVKKDWEDLFKSIGVI